MEKWKNGKMVAIFECLRGNTGTVKYSVVPGIPSALSIVNGTFLNIKD
jgi:hypothetical protein